jgi:hypothetical protein
VARSKPEIVHATGGAGGEVVVLALLAVAAACAAIAVATLGANVDRVKLPSNLSRWFVPATLVAAVLVFFAAGGAGLIEDGWDEFNGDRAPVLGADPAERLETAATTRSEVWDVALDAFSDEPIGGIGPGRFENYWPQHAPTQEYIRDAHSLYIEQLAELGLPGLLAVLVAIGGGLALAVRARMRMTRSADIGPAAAMISTGIIFAISAGFDWMWELTAVTALGLSAIGVMLASQAERVRRGAMRPAVRAGAVVLAVLAVASQVPGLISTARERESTDRLAEGETASALTLADEAIDAEPWSSSAYLQRAAVEVVDGRLSEASADAKEAVERDPESWRPWFALVQIELARGDDEAAERAFSRLERFSLASAVPYLSAATIADDDDLAAQFAGGCLARAIGNCF